MMFYIKLQVAISLTCTNYHYLVYIFGLESIEFSVRTLCNCLMSALLRLAGSIHKDAVPLGLYVMTKQLHQCAGQFFVNRFV